MSIKCPFRMHRPATFPFGLILSNRRPYPEGRYRAALMAERLYAHKRDDIAAPMRKKAGGLGYTSQTDDDFPGIEAEI